MDTTTSTAVAEIAPVPPSRAARLLPQNAFPQPPADSSVPTTVEKPAELGWWDWAVFLLHTVAEIEHALLVQYLYAAYSLRDDLTGDAASWSGTITGIAREEMGHLLTEQNILRFVAGPLNLEREDFPFRSHLYPFHFALEPLTKDTVAKYVAAERPANPGIPEEELAEILARAEGAGGGTDINRVGPLFDTLVEIFSDPAKIPDSDFRPATADDLQGRPDDWRSFFGIIVRTVSSRSDVVDALTAIGQEGEGTGTTSPPDNSHFARFLQIYRQFPDGAGPGADPVTRPIPVNPTTAPEPAAGQAGITDATSLLWAQLFNVRYRMLLTDLAHALLIPGPNATEDGTTTARGHLTDWTFAEMHSLRDIGSVLVELPLTSTGDGPVPNAGPPFEMPFTLALADTAVGRWRLHVALLDNASALVTGLHDLGVTSPVLDDLATADAEARLVAENELAQAATT